MTEYDTYRFLQTKHIIRTNAMITRTPPTTNNTIATERNEYNQVIYVYQH